MTYLDLVEYCTTQRDDYYEQLLINSAVILKAYRKKTQQELGIDLGLNQAQISLLLKLLIAYEDIIDDNINNHQN